MNRMLLTVVICMATMSSCSYVKNVRLLMGGEIRRENYVQEIPFKLRKDLIVINARLNADTTLREFIFDTGAFNSKVESDLAENLGLEVVTEKTNSTAQGISQKIEVVRIDSLQLGETTIYSLGAGKLRYADNSASPCIAAHGIIGANLIKLAHWKIDYEKQLLYFSDMPFLKEKNSGIVPFERPALSGTPTINLEIEGKIVQDVLFDVGFNGGLVLPISDANAFKEVNSEIILDQSTSGIYGTNIDSLIVMDLEVNLGGIRSRLPVEFSSLNKALLGSEFLKHFQVIIDYDKNEIALSRRQFVRVNKSRNFLVGIKNDSLWVVNRTTPELPFSLGETLLSVNDKKPHEAFSSYCDYIMNSQRIFEGDSLLLEKMDGTLISIPNK